MTTLQQVRRRDGTPVAGARSLSDAKLFTRMLRVRVLDERMLKLQRADRIGFVGTEKGLELVPKEKLLLSDACDHRACLEGRLRRDDS